MPDEARSVVEHTFPAATHGRYLVSAADRPHAPMLVGFHGYAETAEEDMERLRAIPGIAHWTVVSIEGLHQFYRRKMTEVAASWMTRQHRELRIVDNVRYVSDVVGRLADERPDAMVMAGFSQGTAMAFRAAAACRGPLSGVIACGGDVPPELTVDSLARIPSALIGRGARDEWYTAGKLADDERRLRAAGVGVETTILDAGHAWTLGFSNTCAQFLKGLDR